jgi:hypothetical protein
MPLARFRETEKKIFFRSRFPSAPAVPGNTKVPGYLRAIWFSGCGTGWGARPKNPTLRRRFRPERQYGNKCGVFTRILKITIILIR